MLETISLRDLREMFTDAEPDTVRVEEPTMLPVTFARVETAPRTSVAVER
jgi:hypothetical protein